MSNRLSIKTCVFCGKTYESKKCDSMYCSATCRKYAYIGRDRRIMGQYVSSTYIPYNRKKVTKPDNQTIENGPGTNLGKYFEEELLKAFKAKGLYNPE